MEKEPLLGGKKLQLPVYLGAAGDGVEATALYWFISRRADFARVGYEPDDERNRRFRATLGALLGGIRSGAFPAVPGDEDEYYNSYKNCGFCDFDRICSRR